MEKKQSRGPEADDGYKEGVKAVREVLGEERGERISEKDMRETIGREELKEIGRSGLTVNPDAIQSRINDNDHDGNKYERLENLQEKLGNDQLTEKDLDRYERREAVMAEFRAAAREAQAERTNAGGTEEKQDASANTKSESKSESNSKAESSTKGEKTTERDPQAEQSRESTYTMLKSLAAAAPDLPERMDRDTKSSPQSQVGERIVSDFHEKGLDRDEKQVMAHFVGKAMDAKEVQTIKNYGLTPSDAKVESKLAQLESRGTENERLDNLRRDSGNLGLTAKDLTTMEKRAAVMEAYSETARNVNAGIDKSMSFVNFNEGNYSTSRDKDNKGSLDTMSLSPQKSEFTRSDMVAALGAANVEKIGAEGFKHRDANVIANMMDAKADAAGVDRSNTLSVMAATLSAQDKSQAGDKQLSSDDKTAQLGTLSEARAELAALRQDEKAAMSTLRESSFFTEGQSQKDMDRTFDRLTLPAVQDLAEKKIDLDVAQRMADNLNASGNQVSRSDVLNSISELQRGEHGSSLQMLQSGKVAELSEFKGEFEKAEREIKAEREAAGFTNKPEAAAAGDLQANTDNKQSAAEQSQVTAGTGMASEGKEATNAGGMQSQENGEASRAQDQSSAHTAGHEATQSHGDAGGAVAQSHESKETLTSSTTHTHDNATAEQGRDTSTAEVANRNEQETSHAGGSQHQQESAVSRDQESSGTRSESSTSERSESAQTESGRSESASNENSHERSMERSMER